MRSHGRGRWGEAGGCHGVPVLSPQPGLGHNQNPHLVGASGPALLNKYALPLFLRTSPPLCSTPTINSCPTSLILLAVNSPTQRH